MFMDNGKLNPCIVITISTTSEPNMMEISAPMKRFIRDLVDEMIEEDMKIFFQEDKECSKDSKNQNRN